MYTAINPKKNFRIKTDAGISIDRSFLAHLTISADNAKAASANGILPLTALGVNAVDVLTGISNPEIPRNMSIVGTAGVTGDVVITGKNYAGEEIEETIALNGNITAEGSKAFKTVSEINLPSQTHTPTAQQETIAVTAGCTQNGVLVVTVTSALFASPVEVEVEVDTDDNETSEVAAKIRSALTANASISANYTVGGSGANIVLTAKVPAANDGTLQISMVDAPATGVTVSSSENTTSGVAGTAQVETVIVTAGADKIATLVVTVTSALLDGGSKAIEVEVTADDNEVGEVGAKIRSALTADPDIAANYTVSGADANVILTAKVKAANDGTLAIALTDADTSSVTLGASANTTPGVASVLQKESISVTHEADAAGTLVFTVTAANMQNSPKAVNVDVDENDDSVSKVAAKIRSALNADADISAFLTIGGTDGVITITSIAAAANDATMAMALSDAPTTGVAVGASANTTAGVGYDVVSVGYGNKIGLPYKLQHNSVYGAFLNNVKEAVAPTVATSTTAIESNTILLNSALNGTAVDVYLVV